MEMDDDLDIFKKGYLENLFIIKQGKQHNPYRTIFV
jgi:hypothetical protein